MNNENKAKKKWLSSFEFCKDLDDSYECIKHTDKEEVNGDEG
jgi:hypothetical protein